MPRLPLALLVVVLAANPFAHAADACMPRLDAPRAYPMEYAVTADDFDTDGRQDVLNYGPSGIEIFYGRGDGTLEPAALIRIPVLSYVVSADVDGDARPDLISREYVDDLYSIVLRRNLGARRFADRVVLLRTTEDFHVGHFITGGGIDILARNVILANDGRGNFTQTMATYPRAFVRVMGTGDFDGDGHTDIAGTDFTDILFLRGEGDGRFPTVTSFPNSGVMWDIEVADFDRNGRDDAAVSHSASSSVSIFLDPLNGRSMQFATGESPGPLLGRDFDGDGDVDLAVAEMASHGTNNQAPALSIFSNDGRGGFTRIDRLPYGNPIDAADFDGDGDVDFLTGHAIVRGNGNGTFATPAVLPSFGPWAYVRKAADLDGDGIDEILLTSHPGVHAHAYVGRFGRQPERVGGEAMGPLDAGELTNDRGLEIVSRSGSRVVVYAHAFGEWQERQTIADDVQVFALIAHDFTGDGRAEVALIVAHERQARLRVLTADGILLFEAPVEVSAMLRMTALDANGDGISDLAIMGSGTYSHIPHEYTPQANGYVALRYGIAGGRFGEETRILEKVALRSMAAGDFDGNGTDDVAVSTWNGRVLMMTSRRDRTFGAPVELDLGGFRSISLDVFAGDLDQDGRDELAVLIAGNAIVLFEGTRSLGAFDTGSSSSGVVFARTRDRARPSIVLPLFRSGEIMVLDWRCAAGRRRAVSR